MSAGGKRVFLVLLRFTEQKALAASFMAEHQQWIDAGFADGVFVLVGGLPKGPGGAVVAWTEDAAVLEARLRQDSFVREGIVTVELIEIAPSRADARLRWLLDDGAEARPV